MKSEAQDYEVSISLSQEVRRQAVERNLLETLNLNDDHFVMSGVDESGRSPTFTFSCSTNNNCGTMQASCKSRVSIVRERL